MTQTEALRFALEALESITWVNSYNDGDYLTCNFKSLEQAITAIKAALEAKDEPVATKNNDGVTLHLGWDDLPVGTKLYATPPQRKPLDEEELEKLWDEATDHMEHFCSQYWDFARAIEAAHGIKETA